MNVIKACRYGMMVYNTNDQYVGRSLNVYGEYSEGEVDIFRILLNQGDAVIDVGANIGALTLPLCKIVGYQGSVIAFEPQFRMHQVLCANIAINNITNAEAWMMAVGKERGSVNVPIIDITQEANYGSLSLIEKYEGDVVTKLVPMIALDDASFTKCELIKIDVEGMELDVLMGAEKTIEKFRPVLIVEDDRPNNRDKLRELLKTLDYRIFDHRPLLYNGNNFCHVKRNVFVVEGDLEKALASFNLVCIPKENSILNQKLIDANISTNCLKEVE